MVKFPDFFSVLLHYSRVHSDLSITANGKVLIPSNRQNCCRNNGVSHVKTPLSIFMWCVFIISCNCYQFI